MGRVSVPRGSWRDMYLTQPPTTLYIQARGRYADNEQLVFMRVGPCTLGEMIDSLEEKTADLERQIREGRSRVNEEELAVAHWYA